MKRNENIVVNSVITGIGDTIVSLLAALAIIPIIFSLLPHDQVDAVLSSGNTGLTFIWIPQLFGKIEGGYVLMLLFFITLCCAALSSLIAMVELVTRIFMDAGVTRKKAVYIVGITGFLCGIPSALKIAFLKNQDWTWGLGLLLNGIFLTYVVIKYGAKRFRKELINSEGSVLRGSRWFEYTVRFIIPLEFVCVIGWWFWQSITVFEPQGWWNPFHTTSVGTCIMQWGTVIIILLLLNRWLCKKMFA